MTRDMTAARPKEKAQALDALRTPLSLYRVFWLFLIAGVAGDFIEVVFWLVTRGELTSRSSLLYGPFSIVWGAAAIVWVRLAYPALLGFVERIPRQRGRRMAVAAALFLTFSTILSGLALGRMDQRREGVPASGPVGQFLDETYPDSVLHQRYPNMGILSEIGWYGGGAG